MKYWAWIDNQVKGPYEKDELLVLPGFTNETLIQEYIPEGGEQQWLCAYNFFDVQEVITQTSHNIQQDSLVQQPSPEPEIYQEDADAKSVAAQFNTVQKESSPHENLEITLLEKLEYLTREIQELKREMFARTQAMSQAPLEQTYAQKNTEDFHVAAPHPHEDSIETYDSDELVSPTPNTLQPKDTQQQGEKIPFNTDQRYETEHVNFLSEVVNTDAKAEPKTSEKVEKETEKPNLDPIDLTQFRKKRQDVQQQQPTSAAADQNPIEKEQTDLPETPQMPLPSEEELQVEELQAEPYAGANLQEGENIEMPLEEEHKEYVNQKNTFNAEPEKDASLQSQPESEGVDSDLITVDSNKHEEAVLEEFAAEKDVELSDSKQQANNNFVILESSEPEHTATSLEELTSRVDVINDANATPSAPQLKSVQTLEDDKFLKTFTTGIEEVFMDQPTSVISDYIPPVSSNTSRTPISDGKDNKIQDIKAAANTASESENVLQHNLDMQAANRIKPTDIKTVPLVSSGDNDKYDMDLGVLPQVEEVIVEAQESPIFGIVKVFFGIVGLVITALLIVALLAQMSIIPVKYSPAHNILSKIMSSKKTVSTDVSAPAQQTTDAYSMLGNEHENTIMPNADTMSQQIIIRVKNYLLIDGLTVEEKINILHPTVKDQIQWTAAAVDPDYYSVAAKLPPNNAGYSLPYLFNYNIVDHSLTPTTSEAKNLINSPQPAVRP